MRIHVLIVHGIGKAEPGYAAPLIKDLKKKFSGHIRGILKTSDDYADELVIKEIVWDDILAQNQEQLALILKKGFAAQKVGAVRSFFRKIFFLPSKWILRLRTDFAAESVSDIIGYYNDEAYEKIHERLLSEINSLPAPAEKQPLSIIAHSLGTVISSDFVYDRRKKHGALHEKFVFSNFFTLGSPIALFALQYGIELFKSPIHVEDPAGRWINIFDLDDPIAYPLRNLNDAYEKAVHLDRQVNTGGFGVSHTRYFGDGEVQETIAAKLAEDWVRVNERSNPARLV